MEKSDTTSFISAALILIAYAWICFLCALLGIFYPLFIWTLTVCVSTFLWYKKLIAFPRPSTYFIILGAIAGIASLFILFLTEPSIYSGRDQGSLASAAYTLQQNHTLLTKTPLIQAFFEVYGPGKALNFPGFHYTSTGALVSQFPIPYIAFLGGFIGVFGAFGIHIANAVLLFFFLTSTTLIVSSLSRRKWALCFLGLLLCSFPTLWFAKYTLSENLAGPLFWIAILAFITKKSKSKNPRAIGLLFLLALGLLFFVRIEGIVLATILIVLYLKSTDRKVIIANTLSPKGLVAGTLFIVVSLLTLLMSTPFFKTILGTFIPKNAPSEQLADPSTVSTLTSFLIPVYVHYGLLLPLLATITLIVYLLIKRQRTNPVLFVFIVSAPLFFYYIDPQISNDHPWMLRRFAWILLPVTLMGTVFLAYTAQRIITKNAYNALIMVSLMAIGIYNLAVTVPYLFFVENKNLASQMTTFAENFTKDDLVLLAPEVTGDGWSMLGAPLRNYTDTNAVYFFNQEDFAKIDTGDFSRIFLVVPTHQKNLYTELIAGKKQQFTQTFQTKRLSREADIFEALPQKKQSAVVNTIYRLK